MGFEQSIGELVILIFMMLFGAIITNNNLNYKYVFITSVYFFIVKFLLFSGFGIFTYPDIIPGRFNWEGKTVSILFTLIFAFFLTKKKWKEIGLTWKQTLGFSFKATKIVSLIFFIIITLYAFLYLSGTQKGGPEIWGYQLTMPSLDEELFYRGFLLFLVINSFSSKKNKKNNHILLSAIIITVLFGISHGLRINENWMFSFDILYFLYSGIIGAFLMYIRMASGSLALPIFMHSWSNISSYIL